MAYMPIKVLLVEDNLADIRLVYEGFAEPALADFHMTHVRRLSETLVYLRQEACDVVLLDLGLPDSHGLETLTLLRAQAPRLPIVVLTGFEDEALAVEAMKSGAQDYLVKGQVDSKLMARSIRYAISRKDAEEALTREAVAQAVAAELRRSRQRIIATQERVRRNIAFRLERDVRMKLLTIKDRLHGAIKTVAPSSESALVVKEVMESLDKVAQKEIDSVITGLYPAILIWGLVPALQSLADQAGTSLPVDAQFDDEIVVGEKAGTELVPEQIKLTAYRIAEEALEKVAKQAQATSVTLKLQLLPDGWLRLVVRADGQIFDGVGTHNPLEIATMRDYAEAAGGQCVVTTAPGMGGEVTATLPLALRTEEHPESELS